MSRAQPDVAGVQLSVQVGAWTAWKSLVQFVLDRDDEITFWFWFWFWILVLGLFLVLGLVVM
jgi:hypothetical protein